MQNKAISKYRGSTGQKNSFTLFVLNLLKPTGYVMHHQFNIQQLYALSTLYFVFCIYLRTNSDLCHLQH
jgi:hypothetical protein